MKDTDSRILVFRSLIDVGKLNNVTVTSHSFNAQLFFKCCQYHVSDTRFCCAKCSGYFSKSLTPILNFTTRAQLLSKATRTCGSSLFVSVSF